jgi:SAM-dependent methyltransferase
MKRARKSPAGAAHALKLDLACGRNKAEGFTGVDACNLPGVDVVWDLDRRPWPWDDGAAAEARCSHYVEHVRDLMGFMDELYRVLAPGASCLVVVPYYTSIRAWQDPTHVRAVSEASFLYFNRAWRESQGLGHYPVSCDFDFSYAYVLDPAWAARAPEARDFAIRHYVNVVSDLQVVLVKRG